MERIHSIMDCVKHEDKLSTEIKLLRVDEEMRLSKRGKYEDHLNAMKLLKSKKADIKNDLISMLQSKFKKTFSKKDGYCYLYALSDSFLKNEKSCHDIYEMFSDGVKHQVKLTTLIDICDTYGIPIFDDKFIYNRHVIELDFGVKISGCIAKCDDFFFDAKIKSDYCPDIYVHHNPRNRGAKKRRVKSFLKKAQSPILVEKLTVKFIVDRVRSNTGCSLWPLLNMNSYNVGAQHVILNHIVSVKRENIKACRSFPLVMNFSWIEKITDIYVSKEIRIKYWDDDVIAKSLCEVPEIVNMDEIDKICDEEICDKIGRAHV